MSKNRLEAFSDGVLAIIITIMVLELKTPDGTGFAALSAHLPQLLLYLLSFVFIGTYWSNHHHLIHSATHVNGRILWANLHLLFWLSLIPFATNWMSDSKFASLPVSFYGFIMWMSGFAYFLLTNSLLASHPKDSLLASALGAKTKELLSLAFYTVSIPLAFFQPDISIAIYVLTACMWLIPDPRIESRLKEK